MKEYITEFAALLVGLPNVVVIIGASGVGSLVICMIMIDRGDIQGKGVGGIVRRFLAGWLGGAFLSPMVTPIITAIVKVPDVTGSFVSGGSGYWIMDKYLSKKQGELLNKPPDEGTNKNAN